MIMGASAKTEICSAVSMFVDNLTSIDISFSDRNSSLHLNEDTLEARLSTSRG